MSEFLEERLAACVRMGATYADAYDVDIVETGDGSEYRRLVHPFPRRTFVFAFTQLTESIWNDVLGLYHRAYGTFAGFRVKALDDFSTNARTQPPTATDQPLEVIDAGEVYRLQVRYGAGNTPLTIGLPMRTIFKPVAGTVRVGVGGVELTAGWSVDTTTGRVTFAANKSRAITDITQAAQAVVTVGAHTFVNGDSVHFSGVTGMTQINGLRGHVVGTTGTTITVDIDSSGFSAYVASGTANTAPQAGEDVTGGCEFDIPCRFNSRLDVAALTNTVRDVGNVELVELLNP